MRYKMVKQIDVNKLETAKQDFDLSFCILIFDLYI